MLLHVEISLLVNSVLRVQNKAVCLQCFCVFKIRLTVLLRVRQRIALLEIPYVSNVPPRVLGWGTNLKKKTILKV